MATVLSSEGKVHAFEPALANRKFLQQHIRINDLEEKVVVEPFLVGDLEIEDQKFYETGADSGMNSITPIGKGEEINATSKKQVTIDGYCFEKIRLFQKLLKLMLKELKLQYLKEHSRS